MGGIGMSKNITDEQRREVARRLLDALADLIDPGEES